MEKRWRCIEKFLWTVLMIQLAMFTSANNITATAPQVLTEDAAGGYAWRSWGSWSACSRTCGGGVAVQERQCLPRSRVIPEGTLPPPIITVRVTRQVHGGDCAGVDRRYHECNTAPCPGGIQDLRAEQCAAYDRRPFRGRFYTWVPYVDGDSPCMLNCRPLGQHFYASLTLVADGTPCTKPGFRAICVQGTCKSLLVQPMPHHSPAVLHYPCTASTVQPVTLSALTVPQGPYSAQPVPSAPHSAPAILCVSI